MLAGRVALVTGASRGVGRAIALALADGGAAVGVNYQSNASAADEVVRAITDKGGVAIAYQASMEDLDAVSAMAEQVVNDLGAPDILVSNAGMSSNGKKIISTDDAEFRRLMDVHAFGPIQLIRALLPGFRAHDRSDIVFISSSVTSVAPSHSAPYTMAKAAIEAAAKTLAVEERKYGLRANIVAPGLVATDMGSYLVGHISGSDIRDVGAGSPYGRVCRPEDIAAVVAFLVSDGGGYVNGQRIQVDGGGPDGQIY